MTPNPSSPRSSSTAAESPRSRSTASEMDFASATHLLGLGLDHSSDRPVDELIAHFREGAARAWVESALEQAELLPMGQSRAILVEGRTTPQQLAEIKTRSKQLLKGAIDSSERHAALAGYFLTIAASVAHFQSAQTGRSLREIHEVLADLAVAAPEPWSEMLGKAIVTLEGMM